MSDKIRSIPFKTAVSMTLIGLLSSSVVNASQFVADLVPSAWETINRQVVVRDKMYSANLYGAPATIQVMFESNGQPSAFQPDQLSANNASFSCRDSVAGDDIDTASGFVESLTKVCEFLPMQTLTTRDSSNVLTTEEVRTYVMRVKFKKATDRSVKLRHARPADRHCDTAGDSSTYNPLDTCLTVTKSLTLTGSNIFKPFVSRVNSQGVTEQWTPLALKNNVYEVTLAIGGGTNNNKKVLVENGLKLKVSGSISALPNDELLEGAEFSDTNCVFEKQVTLTPGNYTCTFTAEEDGFIHIPLKKAGSATGGRNVTVTIKNLSVTP